MVNPVTYLILTVEPGTKPCPVTTTLELCVPLVGAIEITGPVTVRLVLPVTPEDGSVAVIVTVPVLGPPVTKPVDETVAMVLSEDVHVTESLRLPVVRSE